MNGAEQLSLSAGSAYWTGLYWKWVLWVSILMFLLQQRALCFLLDMTWRNWRQHREESTTTTCSRPAQRWGVVSVCVCHKTAKATNTPSLFVVSGYDFNSGDPCACYCDGKWGCHGSRLPTCCKLWHCRGNREVHLCYSRSQRGSVLLYTSCGHREGCTPEGKFKSTHTHAKTHNNVTLSFPLESRKLISHWSLKTLYICVCFRSQWRCCSQEVQSRPRMLCCMGWSVRWFPRSVWRRWQWKWPDLCVRPAVLS